MMRRREGGRERGREGEKDVPMRGMVVMGKRTVSKEERRVFSCCQRANGLSECPRHSIPVPRHLKM